MFQTAKPTKIFQDVVAQIEEAILTGRIKTGQTLPQALLDWLANPALSRGLTPEELALLEQLDLEELRRRFEALRGEDGKSSIPPLYGALLKNEQDVHLLERLAFMHRREKR